MLIYLLIFLISLFTYYSKYLNRWNTSIFLLLYLSLLMLFVGCSDMLGGYDRYIYGELFDDVADNLRNGNLLWSYIFLEYPKELGYDYLNVAIALLTQNRYIFILILTIIIYILTFVSFKIGRA